MTALSRVKKLLGAMLTCSALASTAQAETLAEALALAYANNSTLNAQRASVRSVDDSVPIAKSGLRPTVAGSLEYGYTSNSPRGGANDTGSMSLSVSQNLFNGFQTRNNVLSAEAAVLASQAGLRTVEQNILLAAATSYMDVIQFSRIVQLLNSNLEFLSFEVKAARDRFEVGDGTRTDIALAEGAFQGGRADLFSSQSSLAAAIGTYRQVIGVDPRGLSVRDVFKPRLPKTLRHAIEIGLSTHPSILEAQFAVDQQLHTVKSTQGQLLPSLSVTGSLSRNASTTSTLNTAQVTAQVSIPIYQGGAVYGLIRQEKENLGLARINVDIARDQVRADIVAAWGNLEAARGTIESAAAQVRSQQLAVRGVQAERDVGQATTLDVLDSQSNLITAQITLATAERDLVIAGATLLSAIGRLDAASLGLGVRLYDPNQHYDAVKYRFIGGRTPDGR